MNNFNDDIAELEKKGLRRSLVEIEGPQGRLVQINGKPTLLFSSNDYLSLSTHPLVKEAMIEGVERYGAGSGASRLVSGTMNPHIALEERIAEFKGAERAILFNSGYHANTGVIPALVGRGDEIFADKLNHASLIDGSILSRARVRRYPHRDMTALREMISSSTAARKLIVTDSLFSMDGTIAPLSKILTLAEEFNATVYLDDSHGVGILGPGGKGAASAFSIENHPRLIEMGTFGKAFGTAGAFISGTNELIELLINRARTFIFSTSLPPAIPFATITAIDIAEREPGRRRRIIKNSALLRMRLGELKINEKKSAITCSEGDAQIIPLIIGAAETAVEFSHRLLALGFFVQAIRPPTVPAGTARLRITLMSEHSEDDIEQLITAIEEVSAGE